MAHESGSTRGVSALSLGAESPEIGPCSIPIVKQMVNKIACFVNHIGLPSSRPADDWAESRLLKGAKGALVWFVWRHKAVVLRALGGGLRCSAPAQLLPWLRHRPLLLRSIAPERILPSLGLRTGTDRSPGAAAPRCSARSTALRQPAQLLATPGRP